MSELINTIQSFPNSSDTTLLAGWLLGSAILGALVATATIPYLPYRKRQQRTLLWLLIFFSGLFIPLLGSPGVALAMLIGMRWQALPSRDTFRTLDRPQFDPIGRNETGPSARGGLRARITQSTMSTEQRLQSIAALQHLPVMAASPVLRTLLDDTVDDIRLVAFGMLDKEEKKIAGRIHALLQKPVPASGVHRYLREKQLAELYWELTYSGLVHGDLRRYTLDHALSHAEAALAINDKSAGMHFLAGRILNAMGREADAEQRIRHATALGIPKQRTQPYLAEFAFKNGDYPHTRELLTTMHDSQLTSHLRPVVDYWSPQENA